MTFSQELTKVHYAWENEFFMVSFLVKNLIVAVVLNLYARRMLLGCQ